MLVVRLLLALLGIARTQQVLGNRSAPARPPRPGELERWRQRASALQRIGRLVPGSHCLARSVTLWWWMRRTGLDARLRIGVRADTAVRSTGALAHAWVECAGQLVNDAPANIAVFEPLDWPLP